MNDNDLGKLEARRRQQGARLAHREAGPSPRRGQAHRERGVAELEASAEVQRQHRRARGKATSGSIWSDSAIAEHQRGSATLKGNLTWAGSPQSIDYSTLTGHLDIKAEKGAIPEGGTGAARLIGIVSTPLTLDFRELRERGFRVQRAVVRRGHLQRRLTTRDFRMSGPSAQVSMSGRVDVVNETQDLQARVEPSSGRARRWSSPPWSTRCGLGAFILQKILNNPARPGADLRLPT